MLPFTPDQFLLVFARYNHAIWPAQIGAYLLGGVAVALLFWKPRGGDRAIAGILAAMWLWTAIAYHAFFFASINKAAYLFAALFVIQGGYFFYEGYLRGRIHFTIESGPLAWLGLAFVTYAAALYPLIGRVAGHTYPAVPMFGLTPCPVTIFTFGMLLATVPPLSRWLLVIPVVWSLIGGSAAILLHVPQDWFLLVSGLIAVPLLALRSPARRLLQTS
ncbi:DUF6064 family protein [Bradyrhizobium sp. LMTR 3]|uniref:DUF6064 family protein n=1 Tax=Bradyrhizobium sp. LMTR 3 TaxID=189873 RepID=UPI000810AC03|nr:DUF6064 family protein [Bradyrhizobium sp. LMTR 3]OCK56663.1 hypothetical protein LMTR3_13530 [Bradyrhizobium sp. LMTR 3]